MRTRRPADRPVICDINPVAMVLVNQNPLHGLHTFLSLPRCAQSYRAKRRCEQIMLIVQPVAFLLLAHDVTCPRKEHLRDNVKNCYRSTTALGFYQSSCNAVLVAMHSLFNMWARLLRSMQRSDVLKEA